MTTGIIHRLPNVADRRSARVVFLAHCLLNQNTRYPGGACRACCVAEIVEQCLANDLGIVQMPCPEEHAWGGVAKRRFLRLIGQSRKGVFGRLAIWVLRPVATAYSWLVFARLARRTARQIADYKASGFEVAGIVGVDASPSCGVNVTLPMGRSIEAFAAMDPETVTANDMNRAVEALAMPGRGMFIRLLQRALLRRGLATPVAGHDLLDELRGKRSTVDLLALPSQT